MKKQVVSAITAVALVLAMGLSALAVGEISSITGGMDVSSEGILTTRSPITDNNGKVILVEDAEGLVIKITTVAQASDANQAAGAGASDGTIANNSRTVGQNRNLIAEYEKTKNAKNAKEALETIGATAAVEAATGIAPEELENYAEIQILDVAFTKEVQQLAQKSRGVTLAMRIAGIGADSKGFIVYNDLNGNPQAAPYTILDVDQNGNARIAFTLPNPSVVRIYTTMNL